MKGKIIGFLVCTLLVTTIFPHSVSSEVNEGSTIIYVDDDGTADYTIIQDAIDNASNGDTIIVMPGVYYEFVDIDKSIKIIGQDKNTTILDGKKETEIRNNSGFVNITENHVTFGNFTIRNANQSLYALYARSEYTTISDNIILNEGAEDSRPHYGIRIVPEISTITIFNLFDFEKGYNNICRNLIKGNFTGGIVAGGIENIVRDNILNGSFSFYGIGIGDRKNNVENNVVSNCLYGISTGVVQNKIKGNIITNNKIGIDLNGAYYSTISNNQIENNEIGIESFISTNNKITENNFINNGKNILIYEDFFNIFRRVLTLTLFGLNGINTIGKNTWDRNFYDDQTTAPYKIPSAFHSIWGGDPVFTYYLNFDWHPAKEPYDIPIVEEKL